MGSQSCSSSTVPCATHAFLPSRLSQIGFVGAFGLTLGCTDTMTEEESFHARQSVVYGIDDRVEVYAEPSDALAAVARNSTLALILNRRLSREAGGRWVLVSSTAGERHGLCLGEPYESQPAASDCTATLVAQDLVVTAGHCVWSASTCRSYAFVFNYWYSAPNELREIDDNAVYQCKELVFSGNSSPGDASVDLAVVRLDRPVIGFTPVQVAPSESLSLGAAVALVGTTEGVPIKIDRGAIVQSYVGSPSIGFMANVDAFLGSSGSGVFSVDGQLTGVLSSGQNDFQSSGNCQVTRRLDNSEGEESILWAALAIDKICRAAVAPTYPCGEMVEEGPSTAGSGGASSSEEVPTRTSRTYACNLAVGEPVYRGLFSYVSGFGFLFAAATMRARQHRPKGGVSQCGGRAMARAARRQQRHEKVARWAMHSCAGGVDPTVLMRIPRFFFFTAARNRQSRRATLPNG